MTLIEVMIVVALVALLSGSMFVGMGGLANARLRESSTQVMSAIRIAYTHANATSRPTRLVFDFESRTITIEDSPGKMFIRQGEKTGGAAGATELERAVIEESQEILTGPRAARPSFTAIKPPLGTEYEANSDKKAKGHRALSDKIVFRQIEVAHEETVTTEGRAYLYFWPGGQTQRASIQIQKEGDNVDDDDVLTITVAPLTGRARIHNGPVEMMRPLRDEDASERVDEG